MVAINSDRAAALTLPDPVPSLGLTAGAIVVVSRGHKVRSGDLVVAQIGGELRACYAIGLFLINLSGGGGLNLFVLDESVEVLGHIEFAGMGDLVK